VNIRTAVCPALQVCGQVCSTSLTNDRQSPRHTHRDGHVRYIHTSAIRRRDADDGGTIIAWRRTPHTHTHRRTCPIHTRHSSSAHLFPHPVSLSISCPSLPCRVQTITTVSCAAHEPLRHLCDSVSSTLTYLLTTYVPPPCNEQ